MGFYAESGDRGRRVVQVRFFRDRERERPAHLDKPRFHGYRAFLGVDSLQSQRADLRGCGVRREDFSRGDAERDNTEFSKIQV